MNTTGYLTDESGRLHVVDENGDTTPVFATIDRGLLHCMIRCPSNATFEAVGLSVGLLRHENEGSAEVLDEDGNVVQAAVAPSGELVPSRGVTLTRMGQQVITPAILDNEGAVITPAVYDTRLHYNFWLSADEATWPTWITQWATNGQAAISNKAEVSTKYQGVELIDPLSITTPKNVLL